MPLPACTQPLIDQCVEMFLDASTELLLEDVQDTAGAPITGATVTATVFDEEDLLTSLVGPLAMNDDGGGDYSVTFKPVALDGFFVGQRVRIVYDFVGPATPDDDRVFNVIAIVCEG